MFKNLFKKSYTANVIRDGRVWGSTCLRVWFWISPRDVHEKMATAVDGYFISDFRRVK